MHVLCTGILSGHPEPVTPSASKTRKRPLFRGAMVVEMSGGGWWPASFVTWSASVASELASLEKGDAVACQARLSLGLYLKDGCPACRIHLQLEKLLALPKPKRARPSMSPDDVPDDPETNAREALTQIEGNR